MLGVPRREPNLSTGPSRGALATTALRCACVCPQVFGYLSIARLTVSYQRYWEGVTHVTREVQKGLCPVLRTAFPGLTEGAGLACAPPSAAPPPLGGSSQAGPAEELRACLSSPSQVKTMLFHAMAHITEALLATEGGVGAADS